MSSSSSESFALPVPSPRPCASSESPAPSWSSSPPPPEGQVPPVRRRAPGEASTSSRPAAAGVSRGAGAQSPAGTASTMTGKDLAKVRSCYCIPREIGLFLPTPDDRVVSSRPGRVAVYEISFKLGFRLPFHPFICDLLNYYSITPSQLVPNSLRTICAFIVLCFFRCIPPTLSLFRAFYILRAQKGWWLFQPRSGRALKLFLPTSVKGWKSRFFFADIDQVRPRWGDPDLRPNSNPGPLPGDRQALGALLTTEIPKLNQLLSEENLRLAGVITQCGE